MRWAISTLVLWAVGLVVAACQPEGPQPSAPETSALQTGDSCNETPDQRDLRALGLNRQKPDGLIQPSRYLSTSVRISELPRLYEFFERARPTLVSSPDEPAAWYLQTRNDTTTNSLVQLGAWQDPKTAAEGRNVVSLASEPAVEQARELAYTWLVAVALAYTLAAQTPGVPDASDLTDSPAPRETVRLFGTNVIGGQLPAPLANLLPLRDDVVVPLKVIVQAPFGATEATLKDSLTAVGQTLLRMFSLPQEAGLEITGNPVRLDAATRSHKGKPLHLFFHAFALAEGPNRWEAFQPVLTVFEAARTALAANQIRRPWQP